MEPTERPTACFLCEPDPALVYERSESFYAMLGHGPIGEGYSLIATHDHLGSMLDLGRVAADELAAFTARVRERLSRYGPAVVTEHGRVAACIATATASHEPHCLHAHRLVFPGLDHLNPSDTGPREGFIEYPDFPAAHRAFDWPGQYLYAEDPDGSCRIAKAPQRIPRQFFRSLVANKRGEPQLADWQADPFPRALTAAQHALGLIA
jgi:diadenosine tetraphosphate (Ap4A) HIT family hydrolase